MSWDLRLGSCLDPLTGLASLTDSSVDALVTDPPAGIGFMGKEWDSDKGGRDQWIAWLSGVVLRTRATRLTTVALLGHVATVVVAAAAVAWIAVVHDQLLDLLIETWRNGHDAR